MSSVPIMLEPCSRVLLAGGLMLLAEGCAMHPSAVPSHAPPPPPPVRQAVRTVQVVVAPAGEGTLQVAGTVGKGKGTGEGVAKGAGGGALAGFKLSIGTGPLGIVLMPMLVAGGTVVGAASGAVVGYATSTSAKPVENMQAVLARNQVDLSSELARLVSERVPLAGKVLVVEPQAVADLRMDVSIRSWGLHGGSGGDPISTFSVDVSYQLSEPDGTVVQSRAFEVGGARRSFAEWSAEGGAPVRKALLDALQAAAEVVTDTAFLVQDLDARPGRGGPSSCGLVHRNPPCSEPNLLAQALKSSLPWNSGKPAHVIRSVPKVEGLLPVFQWEAFPPLNQGEQGADSATPAVTDIRYDLRIWTSVGGGPGDLVYERMNLNLEARTEPPPAPVETEEGVPAAAPAPFVEHRLETPLAPDTEHLWSVRARYRLDGEPRATRWSALDDSRPGRPGSCVYDGIPPHRFHRFRTP